MSKKQAKQQMTTLEPEMEKRITDAMHLFQKSYNNGYRILLDELKATPNKSLQEYHAKVDGLKMLDDPVTFDKFLAQGKSISDVLGFSEDAIDTFYRAAQRLITQKRFKEAKDAFFFLVTVAPQVTECWLSLGYAYGNCDEPAGAIKSYLGAIALSPHKADGYIAFARLCTALNDFPRAQKVCDIGMNFVKQHAQHQWAQELGKMLQQTKNEINQLSQKTK